LYRQFSKLISTLLYSGYFPVAPGTIGTLIAFIVYLLLPRMFVELPCFWVFPLLLLIPVVTLTGEAEKIMEKDDKRIVLDEFLGYFFAVIFLPKSLLIGAAAFLLFRLFDILKPPPIDNIQNWKSGWGIVCDDVMAGIYANLIIQIAYFLIRLAQ
jgi:phosphatidylglycerophosphatase A